MIPMHFWLPEAPVEASTAGSVYMLPDGSRHDQEWMLLWVCCCELVVHIAADLKHVCPSSSIIALGASHPHDVTGCLPFPAPLGFCTSA
jgi:hypothetical protein